MQCINVIHERGNMQTRHHSVNELFAQLGLPTDIDSINRFLHEKTPLQPGILLEKAHFWTAEQCIFLEEEWLKDADWVSSIDLLNILLSKKSS
jgi:hypothetical protein